MAEAWLAEGFRVEVCAHDDDVHEPSADCAVAIDIHRNLERWSVRPESRFLKVLHATGCHWRFQNEAEQKRLSALRERRGVALAPRRQVPPSAAAEVADHITLTGNRFSAATFGHAAKPWTRIPLSSAYEFEWPSQRDFEKAQRRFLWMGSYGMVHKGLDLVLEAFAAMPDLQLTICGRPEKEEDFFRVYEKELSHTPNISFRGWTDPASPDFAAIAATHAAVIYPSCSEGGGGSVIHCMHAGMVPACTAASSVDLDDFGFSIDDATVESVRNTARAIAALPSAEIEQRARAAWEHVRQHHTQRTFRLAYGDYVRRTVAFLQAN